MPPRLYIDLYCLRETLGRGDVQEAIAVTDRLMEQWLTPPLNRFDEGKDSRTGSLLCVNEIELGWFALCSWGKPAWCGAKTTWYPAHDVIDRTHPSK